MGDALSMSDYQKKKSSRITGNVMYIGLILKKFLSFKIFYISVQTLLADYLEKHRTIHFGTKEEIKAKNLNPKDYESDLESMLAFLRRTGEYAKLKIRKQKEKYVAQTKDYEKYKSSKKKGDMKPVPKPKKPVDATPALKHFKQVYE